MNLTNGRLPIPELGLSLGLWQGSFQEIERLWLRWFTLEGELIPVPTEEVIAAKQEAAEAKRRVEKLAERLRQLGVNPEGISLNPDDWKSRLHRQNPPAFPGFTASRRPPTGTQSPTKRNLSAALSHRVSLNDGYSTGNDITSFLHIKNQSLKKRHRNNRSIHQSLSFSKVLISCNQKICL